MENHHQEIYYKVYHGYPLNHIVNNNMDRYQIQNVYTRRIKKPTTKNKDFQYHL